MRHTRWLLVGVGLVCGCSARHAVRAPRDGDIAAMVGEVRADRVQRTIETLAGFGTRNTMSDATSDMRGIGAARRWIENEFKSYAAASGGRLEVSLDSFHYGPDGNRVTRETEIVNVVATLHGSRPESSARTYVVSGHYDSMCTDPKDSNCDAPGADDDASGVAVVLELARVMSRREFDATIVFMAVAGEEQGLVGSKHWAEEAKKRGADVAGMFTNDIVGASRGPSGVSRRGLVRLFSPGMPEKETPEQAAVRWTAGTENDSEARQLGRYAVEQAERYVKGFSVVHVFRRDRYLRGGDHLPFLAQGYPAVRVTEYEENYDHQHQNVRMENGREYGDLPKFCDFGYTADVARVNLAALANLARGPAAPKHVRIVTAKLASDTTVRWDANGERDLAGYEIVWRDTSSPVWQEVRDVGTLTDVTLPLSKDNVVLGVRAVDSDGHRSVVTAAVPGKE